MTLVGIVAAMTIPNLMYKRTQQEYSTKLKTFYSRMENAITDRIAEKGFIGDIRPDSAFKWYLDNIDPYMGHQNMNFKNETFYFKNGSSLKMDKFEYDKRCAALLFDTNSDKLPNELGKDIYTFLLCYDHPSRGEWLQHPETIFGTPGRELNDPRKSRDAQIEACKKAPEYCSRLLQTDQWEYKQDYPYRF